MPKENRINFPIKKSDNNLFLFPNSSKGNLPPYRYNYLISSGRCDTLLQTYSSKTQATLHKNYRVAMLQDEA